MEHSPERVPDWLNHDLLLYHGTTQAHAESIVKAGVDLTFSRKRLDFGPGFYLTTHQGQAREWARQKFFTRRDSSGPPAICTFSVTRDDLARLESLAFVRGAPSALDYWSFVKFCRLGGRLHNRSAWYDIVIGPVMKGVWQEQSLLEDSDQISFHTMNAIEVLSLNNTEVLTP